MYIYIYISWCKRGNLVGSMHVSNSTFSSDSIGWEIVEIMLTRTKAEFGLRILKDRLVKFVLIFLDLNS